MSGSTFVYIVVTPWLLSIFVLLCPNQILATKVTLGIAQWGDTHGMFDLMPVDGPPISPCTPEQKCVGGIPLLMGHIKDTRESLLNDVHGYLSISTGNLVSGENGYLGILGWRKYGEFLNQMGASGHEPTPWYRPDIMSLGIKEFEAGIKQTLDYLDYNPGYSQISNLLTNANCDNHTAPSVEGRFCTSLIVNYKVHQVHPYHNVSIGFVGFVDPLVNKFADAGKLTFTDPADAIAKELDKHDLSLVKFVVAVGTGNYEMSKSIIDKSGGKVKLVIYGGDTKNLTGNYPAKYNNSYIATTGSKYGTRLGWMKLAIDSVTGDFQVEEGGLREVDLSGFVTMDGVAVHYFSNLKQQYANERVAKTRVKLDGAPCSNQECNLGNLVTDSMVHCAHSFNTGSAVTPPPYTEEQLDNMLKGPIISVWHGGALFRNDVMPGQQVNLLDVHKWLAYNDHAYLVKILGSTLRRLFDSSAQALQDTPVPNWSPFLQVSSGLQVMYDDKKKVSRIRTFHMDDGVPRLVDLDDSMEYHVVIPSIMYKGKSVWDYLPKLLLNIDLVNDTKVVLGFDTSCLRGFINCIQPVSIGLDDRILLSYEEVETTEGHKQNSGAILAQLNDPPLALFLTLCISILLRFLST